MAIYLDMDFNADNSQNTKALLLNLFTNYSNETNDRSEFLLEIVIDLLLWKQEIDKKPFSIKDVLDGALLVTILEACTHGIIIEGKKFTPIPGSIKRRFMIYISSIASTARFSLYEMEGDPIAYARHTEVTNWFIGPWLSREIHPMRSDV